MEEIFKVLGDENRLRILNLIMKYELCVCEIEVVLEMTQSNVSRHLGKLKSLGLISSTKDAQWVHYKMNETFADENGMLIEYIKMNFNNKKQYKNDLDRCEAYSNSCYDCQAITSSKDLVVNFLKENN